MELVNNMDGNEVLAHLTLNVPDYYGECTQRERVVELADYLAKEARNPPPRRKPAPPASLREMVKNQRLGLNDEKEQRMADHQPFLLPPPTARSCVPVQEARGREVVQAHRRLLPQFDL